MSFARCSFCLSFSRTTEAFSSSISAKSCSLYGHRLGMPGSFFFFWGPFKDRLASFRSLRLCSFLCSNRENRNHAQQILKICSDGSNQTFRSILYLSFIDTLWLFPFFFTIFVPYAPFEWRSAPQKSRNFRPINGNHAYEATSACGVVGGYDGLN